MADLTKQSLLINLDKFLRWHLGCIARRYASAAAACKVPDWQARLNIDVTRTGPCARESCTKKHIE
jgi:hypothetical protein